LHCVPQSNAFDYLQGIARSLDRLIATETRLAWDVGDQGEIGLLVLNVGFLSHQKIRSLCHHWKITGDPSADQFSRSESVLQRTTLIWPSGHSLNSAMRLNPAFSYIPGAWKS
jgi:hypothetical protein